MSWIAPFVPRWITNLIFGDQTDPASLREAVLANLRACGGVSSPQLIAIDLKANVSVVDDTCRLLVKDGKIRRCAVQINRAIEVDADGPHIASPYVRYELIVVMGDMLAALGQVGSANVAELVKALGATAGHVEHLLHEALDHGWVSVAPDRHDAYTLPRG